MRFAKDGSDVSVITCYDRDPERVEVGQVLQRRPDGPFLQVKTVSAFHTLGCERQSEIDLDVVVVGNSDSIHIVCPCGQIYEVVDVTDNLVD